MSLQSNTRAVHSGLLSGLTLLTAAAFVLFVRTGATTITLANGGGDGGELVRAAYEVGVPHPTGYPLWIILARLSMIVIPVEPAHSVAIFSALCAAVAAGVAGLLTFELLQQWIAPPDAWLRLVASLCVPVILTTERLFWQQATIQETYALDSLLQLCGYFFLLRWIRGTSRFWPVALFTALGLANHLAAISLLGATLVVIVANRERFHRRDQVAAAGCCALIGAFYAFLLIRARMHPLANWGDPSTFQRLLSLISASEYQHFLTERSLGATLLELARWPGRVRIQLGVLGAVAGLWGLGLSLLRQPRVTVPLVVAILINTLVELRDAAPAGPTYLHVTYELLTVFAGVAIVVIPASIASSPHSRRIGSIIGALVCLSLSLIQATVTYKVVDIHGQTALRDQAQKELDLLPPDAVLLTEGDNPLFALWYVQDVLGVRPDVTVWSMNLALDSWYDREMAQQHPGVVPADLPANEVRATLKLVGANLSRRPVFSVSLPAFLEHAYTVTPVRNGLSSIHRRL